MSRDCFEPFRIRLDLWCRHTDGVQLFFRASAQASLSTENEFSA
jgi:hypothetical protein